MRSITLYQPWASLMAYQFKMVETRSWPYPPGHWMAIYAGKKLVEDALVGVPTGIVRRMLDELREW